MLVILSFMQVNQRNQLPISIYLHAFAVADYAKIPLFSTCSPSKVLVVLLIMLFEIAKSNGFLLL